jgi:ADP-ribose pyrophosphatase YjhB (NUDIX family)
MTRVDFRRASRLILLDGERRVLLFRHAGTKGEVFWAPPGGGLEDGETFEEAARREASEELGLTWFTMKRGWERITDFFYIDHPVHQHEWYFLIQGGLPIVSADVQKVHKQEGILEMRWWTETELELTGESVFPEGLASELRKIPPM